MRLFISFIALATLAACDGTSTQGPASGAAVATVDPAALYCQGVGGTVIPATSKGRRADICRLPDGRKVLTATLVNAHNDL